MRIAPPLSLLALLSCSGGLLQAADWEKTVLLRASFNGSIDAQKATGDGKLYSAATYKKQAEAVAGLAGTDVVLENGALHFRKKNTQAVFFKAAGNALPKTGTVSFWLQVDPETELAPGYCDPLQLTDKDYNNSALWVDFTKDDKPRHFRLGVFGELKSWNPKDLPPDTNPAFLQRLVVVKQPPFKSGTWTHVAFTYSGLGEGKGTATLYVNGQKQGQSSAVQEPFVWEDGKAALRLGVNYVGRFDDLMVNRQALSPAEIRDVFQAGRK